MAILDAVDSTVINPMLMSSSNQPISSHSSLSLSRTIHSYSRVLILENQSQLSRSPSNKPNICQQFDLSQLSRTPTWTWSGTSELELELEVDDSIDLICWYNRYSVAPLHHITYSLAWPPLINAQWHFPNMRSYLRRPCLSLMCPYRGNSSCPAGNVSFKRKIFYSGKPDM